MRFNYRLLNFFSFAVTLLLGVVLTTYTVPKAEGQSSQSANCNLKTTVRQPAGPYYTPNAPFRTNLIEQGTKGTRLILTGQVLDANCQGVGGALLDFWQADTDGDYDNSGYKLRGRLYADAQGYYRLETILPGLYPGRPRHIHVKVNKPGGSGLTTQIYFAGERENQSDSIFHPSLVTTLTTLSDGSKQATFDIVLDR